MWLYNKMLKRRSIFESAPALLSIFSLEKGGANYGTFLSHDLGWRLSVIWVEQLLHLEL